MGARLMPIANVGALIAALQKMPADMVVGTVRSDFVGELFDTTVSVEKRFVRENGRLIAGDAPAGALAVVVIR
jgi:hypothetical protein